jgi:hypothetical protein
MTSSQGLAQIIHWIKARASMLPNADHVKACDKAVDILREEIERTGRAEQPVTSHDRESR